MKKRGFTLVELVIALTLFGVLSGIALVIFVSSFKVQAGSYSEYDLQNRIRRTGDKVTEVINTSSAIFTVRKSTFDKKLLSPNWDYYGVTEDGSKYVHYKYNSSTNSHDEIVLVEAGDGFKFKLVFRQPLDDEYGGLNEKFIGYRLEMFKIGETPEQDVSTGYFIDTELEAKNSKQVVHRGTVSNPATAIAVRTSSSEFKTRAVVHMIYDCSTSMFLNLKGEYKHLYGITEKRGLLPTLTPAPSARITLLINASLFIVDEYRKNSNIDLVFYPFYAAANMRNGLPLYEKGLIQPPPEDPDNQYDGSVLKNYTGNPIFSDGARSGTVLNVNKSLGSNPVYTKVQSKEDAKLFVRTLRPSGLNAGTTNLADALRRVCANIAYMDAHYLEDAYPNSSKTDLVHYVIILTDGYPNFNFMYKIGPVTHVPGDEYIAEYTTPTSEFTAVPVNAGNFYCLPPDSSPNFLKTGGLTHTPLYIEPWSKQPTPSLIREYGGYIAGTNSLNHKKLNVRKSFLISFSHVDYDSSAIPFIARSCGVADEEVFDFTKSGINDLSKVFLDIRNNIVKDMWLIEGPAYDRD